MGNTAKSPFYITTAISYANGAPHLGHAYEAILTDAMARFKRLDGYDVHFLTGTDEHGEKVMKTAAENNADPLEFATHNAKGFGEMCRYLDISHDDFIRTTEERHYKAAQAIWTKLQDNDDIYLGKYEGWYSVREEGYFTEDELSEDENGEKITPNGTPVEWVEEESYFFKLSKYSDALLEHYTQNPDFIKPTVRLNEIRAFVEQEGGLRDLSISRHKDRLSWGIPVPGDENHVMYVWLDALTNYITALGYPDTSHADFQKHWVENNDIYHVIGKDITRFHAIYWPAFLIAADIKRPKTVFAHGFINIDGAKMSKSVGNVVAPEIMAQTYGVDQLRYFLLREISHGKDGNFSHEQAVERMNADLANGIGNLAQRTLSMIYKNCDGAFPYPNALNADDTHILEYAHNTLYAAITDSDIIDEFKLHETLMIIMGFVTKCDRYIDDQTPWTLKKEDPERMKTVLYVLAEAIRCIAITIQFATPSAATKLLDQLKTPTEHRLFTHLSNDYALKPATEIDKPEGIFPRLDLTDDGAK